MSLLDKASLIVTPNAYKESKLYSVVPNTTLGDMDVVRATTATRVNSAGLIEVVPRNLLTYSEQFENGAWQKLGSTISFNSIVSPDGANNADKIIEDISTGVHRISQQPTAAISTYTFSVYAKAGERNIVQLRDSSSAVGVWFNLSNGTVGTQNIGVVGSIQNAGNGWYKCTATRTTITSNVVWAVSIADIDGNQSYTGNGVSGLFIWGAQLEVGSTATEYFPTTTRLNIPRIDYTNGSCPSLLVEPQRTNNALYSNSFNNWVVGGILTQNFAISPDGTQNASSLNGYMYEGSNGVGGIVSFSCFAKKINGDNTINLIADSTPAKQAVFNLLNGTVVSVDSGFTANIVNFGNGWYRCIMTSTSSIISPLLIIRSASSGTNSTLVYGVQFEQGSYATSYIPTVASTVTRNADVISKTGISSLIGQTEGVIYWEGRIVEGIATDLFIIGNIANSVFFNITSTNQLRVGIRANSALIASFFSSALSVTNFKIAIAYKSGDIVAYVNGVQVSTNSTTFTFNASVNEIEIGRQFFDPKATQFTTQALLFKTRLSNAELQQLTTL